MQASENAAFDSAIVYLKTARELLGSRGWKLEPVLTSHIYIAEAKARFVSGDIAVMETLVEEVLQRDLPIEDKFGAYELKILAAHGDNKFDEAIAISLDVRRQLRFKRIRTKNSSVTVLREYLKTNRATKGWSTAELAELPDLTDKRIIMGQRILQLVRPNISFDTKMVAYLYDN